MPTTYDVIVLGSQTDLDPIEGNRDAEDASVLVGYQFGASDDPLFNYFATFTPVSGPGSNNYYEQDNSELSTFQIDGGPVQTFDSTAVYNATVTYVDGTTASVTAVVFQDLDGNTYLAPEFLAKRRPDQA